MHRYHAQSLCLSLLALRRCLSLPNLTPEVECRAWTAMVEIGMLVIDRGFSQNNDHFWARGIEIEVEKAASKAVSIHSTAHPTLRLYRPHVTCLTARLLYWQHKSKFALTLLRRLRISFLPSDPPHATYAAHLTLISLLATSNASSTISSSKDMKAPLSVVHALADLADKNRHFGVKSFALVLTLRTLVSLRLWESVDDSLRLVEEALGIECPSGQVCGEGARPVAAGNQGLWPVYRSNHPPPTQPLPKFADKLAAVMAIHTLIIGVVFHTFVGNFARASARLTFLHMLMDSGALIAPSSGVVEITFSDPPFLPLYSSKRHIHVSFSFLRISSTLSQ
ncbi:uncharacterized protein BT62DRAFT_1030831 [Guyanagaster necrorhizus]|uniref:Uncharacterized protein n=1 Tax=Guyanagaster necrorhizus TaxID=856835 RepID=A0A9P8AZ88_9AGAR|nr:uncharacterized protein BT62DRAFT_1030831 [Guyanagaster necrorhizus MCA 3950]KAG7451717.1 hypothetical protein BT62DRAFT_1030831 [Guyanagaster necrorhizus MCA 3950]